MLDRSYTDLALRQAMALLAIDSPTGFTEKAAQWVWQLEVQSQTLKQMEKTRVWKVYQKYRKAVERKHS